ncbi:MAG: hypothetical protein Q8R12_01745 [bacterium]|nr:hypothetical protein [bacterium]
MENIQNFFRFTAPPILGIIFVILADAEKLYSWLPLNNLFDTGLATLVIGSGIIIAFGFLISSIAYAIVNLQKLRITICDEDNRKEILKSEESRARREFEIWEAQDKHEHTRKQIMKRWEMAMANMNSALALFFALIFVLLRCLTEYTTPKLWWLSLTISFIIIFSYNFYDMYKNVHRINCILLKNDHKF